MLREQLDVALQVWVVYLVKADLNNVAQVVRDAYRSHLLLLRHLLLEYKYQYLVQSYNQADYTFIELQIENVEEL